MHVLALVKSAGHVCCRYRVAAFRSHLERAGHTLEIRGWPDFWLSRVGFFYHLKNVDALLVQRKLFPAWQLSVIRRRVRWLLFDYDDSVFLRNSYNPLGTASAERSKRFVETVRSADAVVAGNPFLAGQAAAVTDARRVRVIPTCVDLARYRPARHDAGKGATQLVWVGSSSTIKGLEQIAPVLNRLGKEVSGLQLKVVCDRCIELENLGVVFRPWSEATEADEIATASVGVSWLPDDAWSRGKCGLKVLQYMAAGLPVVANPVGVQADLVRPGETGFLVETADDWVRAIRTLAADPDLRRRMGAAGRRRVEHEFDVPVGAAAWLDVLRALETRPLARAS
jgi:glycosyltransferase involved in cell wall biosynthesis